MNQNQRPNARSRSAHETPGRRPSNNRNQPPRPVKKKKRRLLRRKNQRFWRNLLIALLVTLALFFTMTIFFQVDEIHATGGGFYSEQQIIDASGVQQGDNLLTLSKAEISGKIRQALPYVASIQVKKTLPDKVLICVEERSVSYAVKDTAGAIWLIGSDGMVLAKQETPAQEPVQLTGFTIDQPTVGERMVPSGEGGAAQGDLACQFLSLLEKSPVAGQIVSVDVSESLQISCWYGTQYQITFGGADQLEYKLRYLQEVLTKLDSYEAGEIDLSFTDENKAIFRPFQ